MMADQQPFNENDGLLNFDQAKAAIEKDFAAMIGTLSINNAILEKRLASSQQTVRQLTESEVSLAMHIQELKSEIARLKQQLPLSPEAAALAIGGREIIRDEEAEALNRKSRPG